MKFLLPVQLLPLNLFQIHGTMCCHNMYLEYESMGFINQVFCYEAKTIHEANVLVIWGSISKKLAESLVDNIEYMGSKCAIVHIQGCHLRVENKYSTSSLVNILPINHLFSDCKLTQKNYQDLIREAKKCLRA